MGSAGWRSCRGARFDWKRCTLDVDRGNDDGLHLRNDWVMTRVRQERRQTVEERFRKFKFKISEVGIFGIACKFKFRVQLVQLEYCQGTYTH